MWSFICSFWISSLCGTLCRCSPLPWFCRRYNLPISWRGHRRVYTCVRSVLWVELSWGRTRFSTPQPTGWTLDFSQLLTSKLCLLVFKCLHSLAPHYLAELCVPVADVMGSALCHSRSTKFSLVQVTTWKTMPDEHSRTPSLMPGTHWQNICDKLLQSCSSSAPRKRFLFRQISRHAHYRRFV